MCIEVVDPGGHGIGVAIGLRELGHEVHYVAAHAFREDDSLMGQMRVELVDRMFGGGDSEASEPDLLVLVDVFADHLRCLERREAPVGKDVTHPLQADGGVMVYPLRLGHFIARAQAAGRVAVIDMSDSCEQREVVFDAMPNVQLFAREVHGSGDGRWQALPFLYNFTMLWLEYTRPKEQWLVAENRPQQWDWAFCGTIDHERYGRRRELAIALLAKRWPELRGVVMGQLSFQQVLVVLQSVRAGLDLPGVGELCFRMHECLALGTPVLRPLSPNVSLPAGLAAVVVADPSDLPDCNVNHVRAVYAEHYAPIAAARWLLAAMGLQEDQYSICQATNIATAAST